MKNKKCVHYKLQSPQSKRSMKKWLELMKWWVLCEWQSYPNVQISCRNFDHATLKTFYEICVVDSFFFVQYWHLLTMIQWNKTQIRTDTTHTKESLKVTELKNREVGSERCLSTFFSHNSNSNISCLNHTHIIATITNSCSSFLWILFDEFHNFCFLSWRTSTAHNSRSLTCDLKKPNQHHI